MIECTTTPHTRENLERKEMPLKLTLTNITIIIHLQPDTGLNDALVRVVATALAKAVYGKKIEVTLEDGSAPADHNVNALEFLGPLDTATRQHLEAVLEIIFRPAPPTDGGDHKKIKFEVSYHGDAQPLHRSGAILKQLKKLPALEKRAQLQVTES